MSQTGKWDHPRTLRNIAAHVDYTNQAVHCIMRIIQMFPENAWTFTHLFFEETGITAPPYSAAGILNRARKAHNPKGRKQHVDQPEPQGHGGGRSAG